MKIIVILLLVTSSVFDVAVSKYPLREYELKELDVFVKYYLVKDLESPLNTTVDLYQRLATECAEKVNKTADDCTACIGTADCEGATPNVVQLLLAKVNDGAKSIFNKLTDKLFTSIGGKAKNLFNKEYNKLKNTFKKPDISSLTNKLQGLKLIFSGALDFSKSLISKGLASTKKLFNDIKDKLNSKLKDLANLLKNKIPIIGKRSVRVRREIDPCFLKKCPVCNNINLPDKPTDEQMNKVMANICKKKYPQQTAAQAKIAEMMTLIEALTAENAPRIVTFAEAEYSAGQEKLLKFKWIWKGVSDTYIPTTTMVINTRDLQSLGKKIANLVTITSKF